MTSSPTGIFYRSPEKRRATRLTGIFCPAPQKSSHHPEAPHRQLGPAQIPGHALFAATPQPIPAETAWWPGSAEISVRPGTNRRASKMDGFFCPTSEKRRVTRSTGIFCTARQKSKDLVVGRDFLPDPIEIEPPPGSPPSPAGPRKNPRPCSFAATPQPMPAETAWWPGSAEISVRPGTNRRASKMDGFFCPTSEKRRVTRSTGIFCTARQKSKDLVVGRDFLPGPAEIEPPPGSPPSPAGPRALCRDPQPNPAETARQPGSAGISVRPGRNRRTSRSTGISCRPRPFLSRAPAGRAPRLPDQPNSGRPGRIPKQRRRAKRPAQALRPSNRRRFQVRPASTTRQATAEGITATTTGDPDHGSRLRHRHRPFSFHHQPPTW